LYGALRRGAAWSRRASHVEALHRWRAALHGVLCARRVGGEHAVLERRHGQRLDHGGQLDHRFGGTNVSGSAPGSGDTLYFGATGATNKNIANVPTIALESVYVQLWRLCAQRRHEHAYDPCDGTPGYYSFIQSTAGANSILANLVMQGYSGSNGSRLIVDGGTLTLGVAGGTHTLMPSACGAISITQSVSSASAALVINSAINDNPSPVLAAVVSVDGSANGYFIGTVTFAAQGNYSGGTTIGPDGNAPSATIVFGCSTTSVLDKGPLGIGTITLGRPTPPSAPASPTPWWPIPGFFRVTPSSPPAARTP